MLVQRIGVLLFSLIGIGVAASLWAQDSEKGKEPTDSETKSKNEIPKAEPPKKGEGEVSEDVRVKIDREHPWFRDVISEGPLPTTREGEPPSNEAKAYDYILAHSSKIDAELFKKYAISGVPFQDLMLENTRSDYQRQLLHYEGRLIRLRRFKATPGLGLDKIEWLYEAWILPKVNQKQDPIFLVLTCLEAPEGLEPADEYKKPIWVTFDAFYFKVLTYPTPEKKPDGKTQWRRSPLFLGKGFAVTPPNEKKDNGEWAAGFALATITIALVCAVVFTIIYRRGDKKVKTELDRRLDLVPEFGAGEGGGASPPPSEPNPPNTENPKT